MIHHLNKENIIECYKELKENKGCAIDEVIIEKYRGNLEENVKNLAKRLKDKSDRASRVRMRYIAKSNSNEKHKIIIPTS